MFGSRSILSNNEDCPLISVDVQNIATGASIQTDSLEFKVIPTSNVPQVAIEIINFDDENIKNKTTLDKLIDHEKNIHIALKALNGSVTSSYYKYNKLNRCVFFSNLLTVFNSLLVMSLFIKGDLSDTSKCIDGGAEAISLLASVISYLRYRDSINTQRGRSITKFQTFKPLTLTEAAQINDTLDKCKYQGAPIDFTIPDIRKIAGATNKLIKEKSKNSGMIKLIRNKSHTLFQALPGGTQHRATVKHISPIRDIIMDYSIDLSEIPQKRFF